MNKFEKYFSLPRLFTEENKKMTVILLMAPVVLVTWKYYGTKSFYLAYLSQKFVLFNSAAMTAEWYTFFLAFTLFGLLSLVAIKYIFREQPKAYGLALGDWKFWVPAAAVIGIVMVFISYLSAGNPQFVAEYPLYKGAGDSIWLFLVHIAAYLFFYLGWEIFFRGFMQFGLAPRFGVWGAIFIQTALSCIVHIGKPDSEIYSSIIGAIVWGVVVHRAKSIWPAVATHWLLGISLDFFICFR
jgi:membrane protease YdiL (CAAX protease family)